MKLQNTVTGISGVISSIKNTITAHGKIGNIFLLSSVKSMFHLLKTPFLAAPAEGFLTLPFPLESSAFRLLAPGVGDGRTFERSDNC